MSAAEKIVHAATLADLEALPAHMKGELIDGVLYAMTRPRMRHQLSAGAIHADYHFPYQRGRGGPGGWWILPGPGIQLLPRAPEFSPDLAGWRVERMPEVPDGPITVVPDWVCEVLSPTTRRHNLVVKKPFYASVGVPWLWMVDSEAMAVTVHELRGGQWVEVAVFSDEPEARVPPFTEVAVDLRAWWPTAPAAG